MQCIGLGRYNYSKFISLSDQAAPVTSSICKFLAAGVLAFLRLRSFIASRIPIILWWAHVLSSLSPLPLPSTGGSREARGQSRHSRPPFSYGQVGKIVENKKETAENKQKARNKILVEILHL